MASTKKIKPKGSRQRVSPKPQPLDQAQVNQTVKWVLSGATPFDIVETIKTTYPDEDPARLMLEAMHHFERAGNFEPDIVFGWCFEATKDLYRQMVATGDYPGALRAVKQMMEMARHVHNEEPDDEEDKPAQLTAEEAAPQAADCAGSEPVTGRPQSEAVPAGITPEQPA